MKTWKVFILLGGLALAGIVLYGARLIRHGFSTADEPSSLEKAVAHATRNLAIPRNARLEANPLKATPEVLKESRESFLDRCAICHSQTARGKREWAGACTPESQTCGYPRRKTLRMEKSATSSEMACE